jgi:hypothetical protein
MKRILSIAAVLLLVGAGCPLFPQLTPVTPEPIPPVAEPEPGPAPDPNGPEAKADLIRADIQPGATVSSPLTVTGEARGTWYFEASFPVRLFDGAGNEIAVKPAQAQGDWMTTEFVPLKVTLTFAKPSTAEGVLVLEKDNPSGLPERDDALRIPVRFASEAKMGVTADGCVRTGCSGQICADEEMVSTCDYRPEYACYKEADCERQADGKCGWTPSSALAACLTANASGDLEVQ